MTHQACNHHIFALYAPNISSHLVTNASKTITLVNYSLRRRITKILRLPAKRDFILFDKQKAVKLTLKQETYETKHAIVASIVTIHEIKPLFPPIILAIGLLKPKAFEEVIYNATTLGITTIIPLLTNKIEAQRTHLKQPRLEQIMIAAAEQAKNYHLPVLEQPTSLNMFLTSTATMQEKTPLIKAYFQQGTRRLPDLLNRITNAPTSTIVVVIGPEGGLTNGEQSLLQKNKFEAYHLTNTILRAEQAAVVGIGSIRSITDTVYP